MSIAADWPAVARFNHGRLVEHWRALKAAGSQCPLPYVDGRLKPLSEFTDAEIVDYCTRAIDKSIQDAKAAWFAKHIPRETPRKPPKIRGLGTRWSDYVKRNIEWINPPWSNDDR